MHSDCFSLLVLLVGLLKGQSIICRSRTQVDIGCCRSSCLGCWKRRTNPSIFMLVQAQKLGGAGTWWEHIWYWHEFDKLSFVDFRPVCIVKPKNFSFLFPFWLMSWRIWRRESGKVLRGIIRWNRDGRPVLLRVEIEMDRYVWMA